MAASIERLFGQFHISQTYPPDPEKGKVPEKQPSLLARALLTPTTTKKLTGFDLIQECDSTLHDILKACNYSFEELATSSESLSAFLSHAVKNSHCTLQFLNAVLNHLQQPTYDTKVVLTLVFPGKDFIRKTDAIAKKFPQIVSLTFQKHPTSTNNLIDFLNDQPDLKNLPFIQNIHKLKIVETASFTGDTLIKIMSACKQLTELSFKKCPNLSFSKIYGKYALRGLSIKECDIKQLDLVVISEVFPKLTTLKLSSCKSFTERDFQPIAFPATIRRFKLSSLALTDEIVINILKNSTTLTSLSVSNLPITDRALISITQLYPLQTLDVSHCEKLTPEAFTYFTSQLTSLDASYTSIDIQGIRRIRDCCPNISTLCLAHCDHLPGVERLLEKKNLEQIVEHYDKLTPPQAAEPESEFQFAIDL